MADDYQTILNQYLAASPETNPDFFDPAGSPDAPPIPSQVANATQSKMYDLSTQAYQKMAAVSQASGKAMGAIAQPDGSDLSMMRRTGSGVATADPVTHDYLTMDPTTFSNTYGGDTFMRFANAEASSQSANTQNAESTRSAGQVFGDAANTILSAPVSNLGGLAALGLGASGDTKDALALSQGIGTFGQGMQDMQSIQMQAARAAYDAKQALDERDNQASRATDNANYGNFVGGAMKVGRDAINAMGNAYDSPLMAGDTVANAAGSIIGSGIISKGVQLAGAGAMGTALGEGYLLAGTKVAEKVGALGSKLAMPASIGLMAGGSAYQETIDEAYKGLADRKDLSEDQKVEMANQAGLQAAALQGGFAAAAGPLTGGSEFHENPFLVDSFNHAVRKGIGETVYEGAQEGTAKLAMNYALQQNVNPNQDLTDQVGQAVGLGVVGGLGSAVGGEVPGLIGHSLIAGLQTIGEKTKNALVNSFRGSPDVTSDVVPDPGMPSIVPVSVQVTAPNPIAASPIVQESVKALSEALIPDRTQDATSEAPVAAESTPTQAAKSPLDGLEVINSSDQARMAQVHPDTAVNMDTKSVHDLTQEELDAHRADGADIVGGPKADGTMDFAVLNPKVVAPTIDPEGPATKAAANVIPDMSPKNVADTLEQAQNDPSKMDPDMANKLLFHSDNGSINLTNEQRTTLRAANALSLAAKATSQQAATTYGMTGSNANKVSADILSKTGEDAGQLGKNSLLQHVAALRTAYNSGDLHLATQQLGELRFFAQHMGNKVTALNAALVGGNTSSNNPVRYQSYIGDGKFRLSGRAVNDAQGNSVRQITGMNVSPTNTKSVAFAQQVALESGTVSSVVNNLVDAFPDLGIKHFTAPVLDGSLHGDAATVAKSYTPQNQKGSGNGVVRPSNGVDAKIQDQNSSPVPSENGVAEAKDSPITPNEEGTKPSATAEAVQPEVSKDVFETENQPTNKNTESALGGIDQTGSLTETIADGGAKDITSVKGLYPTLAGSADNANHLHTAFEVPAEPTTRLQGVENPIDVVRTAFGDRAAFEKLLGGELNHALSEPVSLALQSYLDLGRSLLDVMNDRLQSFIANKVGEKHTVDSAINWINGQAANIVEPDGSQYRYNPALSETAMLAGLNWFMKMGQKVGTLDEDGVRTMLQLENNTTLPGGLVDRINNAGVGAADLSRSLASEIQKFWGLKTQNNVGRQLSEGVLEGVAKEIIASMLYPMFDSTDEDGKPTKVGFLTLNKVDISEASVNKNIQELNRYTQSRILLRTSEGTVRKGSLSSDESLKEFPNAIEKAVVIKDGNTTFVGAPPEEVSKDQLRNAGTKNTPQQMKALKTQQEMPHFINQPFMDMLDRFGEKGLLAMFGGGDLSRPLNEVHKASMAGQNLTLQSAYRTIQAMRAEVLGHAELTNTPVEEVPVHYKYDTTVVNRQQMMGLDNPQSNKMVREAVLPTWQKTDLSDPQMLTNFKMGLAQALGIKVHTQDPQMSMDDLASKLASMKPVLDLLGSKKAFSDTQIQTMKDAGLDSFAALHALMEWNRYQGSDEAGRKAFNTATYFEADGVTNGVVNAMSLFSSGPFSSLWINNIARGGLNIGRESMSLAQLRQSFASGNEDLYGIAGTNTTQAVKALQVRYANSPRVMEQMNAVHSLITEFMKDVSVNDQDGTLDVRRGAVKNPMTITIYGSGAMGIAGNITEEVMGKIYEKLSQAAQRLAENPDMPVEQAYYDGDPATAKAQYDALLDNLTTLGSASLNEHEGSLYVRGDRSTNENGFGDPTKFKISGDALKNIRQNILHGFVTPMVKGITQTVGEDLMSTLGTLKTQVQSWSLLAKFAYRNAYQAALTEKYGPKPGNKLLSVNEETQVLKSIQHLLPKFSTGDQNFLFGTSQKMVHKTEFARALDDTLETPAFGYTPDDAGVSGIPGMTIGSGDGMAVLNAINDPAMPSKFLQIFDGIHSTIAAMQQMGEVANKAVYNSWQSNPMEGLSKAFQSLVGNLNLSELNLTDDDRRDMAKSLFPEAYWGTTVSDEMIQNQMHYFAQQGTMMAENIALRQQALNTVQLSVDQMAGAGAPHSREGLILSGSAEQKAAMLEAIRARLASGQDEAPKSEEEAEPKLEENLPVDQPSETRPVRQATTQIVAKMIDRAVAKITPDRLTRALIRDVLRSGAAKDYTIHMGTADELTTKAIEMGILIPADREGFQGFTDPTTKSIFAVDGNPETILHELIHASTYEPISSYFAGDEQSKETVEAITRLQGLMSDFKAAFLEGPAYQNALDEMDRQSQAGNQAGELNEFMAWALSNADLASQLKDTKASKITRLARSVVQGIKALLWGGKRSAAVKDDLFTNLRFNTSIVMRAGSLGQKASEGMLYHDPNYGADQRVSDLLDQIQKKIGDYANVDPATKYVRGEKLNPALVASATVANAFQAAGFNMTMQQRTAFIRMMTIMATDAHLNTNSTQRMQDMYSHVSKNLTVEDFMKTPEENNEPDIEQASKKMDVLLGKYGNKQDAHGRSVILPAFIALASTSDEFRSILAKMAMPKGDYAQWNSVDNILDNIGQIGVSNLSKLMSGEGVRTPDVQSALDNLTGQMLQSASEGKHFIEKMTNPIGDGIDRVNDAVVSAMDWMGKQTGKGVDYIQTNHPEAKIVLRLAQALNVAAGMLNQENGTAAATGLMGTLNGSKLAEPVFNFMKDMIGRTGENAQVYDMIKQSRMWVNGIRQQFREQLPKILNSKFERTLSPYEKSSLYQGLGQTGLANLMSGMKIDQILEHISDQSSRDVAMKGLMDQIREMSPNNAGLIEQKMNELADYMISKKSKTSNLLRNPTAIAHLLGEKASNVNTSKEMIEAIGHLVSLKAVNNMPVSSKTVLGELARQEPEGMNFMLSYLRGQDQIDASKRTGNAKFNYWHGAMPSIQGQNLSLRILSKREAQPFIDQGYKQVGEYAGSSLDPASARGYYFLPVNGRAAFAQGIMQNVHPSTGGVDIGSGFSSEMTAGTITDRATVSKISQALESGTKETGDRLQPMYDKNGNLYGYEKTIEPSMLNFLNKSTDISQMMGVRSGRQSEEASSEGINKALVDALRTMYDNDKKAGRAKEYLNLSSPKDPIHRDAMQIMSQQAKDYIDARFPDGFMVRRDMVDDAIGYRKASIGDVFTGNSRWSPETQRNVKGALIKMFGSNAYRYSIGAEAVMQNLVQDAKVIMVVKSIVVPLANAASNVYQLIGRGVPLATIFKGIPAKVAEIESWHGSRIRQMEAQAELLATDDPIQKRQLMSEIQSITDAHKRMSIWPLLQAGEFSAISDAGSHEDIALSSGRLGDYITSAVNKLPQPLQTGAKYAMLAKDTALFGALEKSVAYGDFIAKGILYDDMTQRKGMTSQQALSQITEEFVNYERLAGRDRQYVEDIGLLWFYNFKMRSSKVALSMIRNNPVHSLISMHLPMPIHGTGLPITDNLFGRMFENKLQFSEGLGLMMRAPGLLPLENLVF